MIKKIMAIIVAQIVFTLLLVMALNAYTFGIVSVSIKTLIWGVKTYYRIFSPTYWIVFSLGLLIWCLALVLSYQLLVRVIKARHNVNTGSQGTARWATNKDLAKQGFFSPSPQMIVGQTYDAVIKTNDGSWNMKKPGKNLIGISGPLHCLTIGGTRSGKGTSTIVPTLLTNRDSVLVFDPKKENYALTAGHRSSFSTVLYLNPSDPNSTCRFNPLDMIRFGQYAISDVQNMVGVLVPDEGVASETFWVESARRILTIFVFDTLMYSDTKTLSDVYVRLNVSDTGKNKSSLFGMFEKLLDKYEKTTPTEETAEVLELLKIQTRGILKENENTLASMISTLNTHLQMFSDPIIAKITSESSFSVKDLRDAEKPMSIYICTAVPDLTRCRRLHQLFFGMILRSQMRELEEHRHRLMVILDEFYRLGRFMEVFDSIPFSAQYGITMLVVVQSTSQLSDRAAYGAEGAKTLLNNFQILDCKQVAEDETAKWISNLLGQETVQLTKASFSHKTNKFLSERDNVQTNEIKRPLLFPDEVRKLPSTDQLFIGQGRDAYRAKKIMSWQHPAFKDLLNLPVRLSKTVSRPGLWYQHPTFEDMDDERDDDYLVELDSVSIVPQSLQFEFDEAPADETRFSGEPKEATNDFAL